MTTTDLTFDLVAWMTADNREHAAAPYVERMAGVEDCIDVLEICPSEDAAAVVRMWWQAIDMWFTALDCFDTAVCGIDRAAETFLRYEAERMMAKRVDVLEAVSKHYAGGHYTDPQLWIAARGTTYICLSNSVVDYGDATGKALRLLKELNRQAKVDA